MRAVRHDARVAFLPQTIRDRAGVHLARRTDERFLLAAHDDRAVLGDGGHELLELLEDLAEVLVVVKMVGLDIGDDDARGREERERLVGLVGLDHVVSSRAGVSVGPIGANDAADEERRVEAHAVERAREHGGRGGLAMRARYRERVEPLAQAREHLGTVDDVEVAAARFFELGVVVEDRRRDDDGDIVAFGHVLCRLADGHGDAVAFQLFGVAALLDIRAGDDHALVMRHMRDTAHAHAADADEMQTFSAHSDRSHPLVSRYSKEPIVVHGSPKTRRPSQHQPISTPHRRSSALERPRSCPRANPRRR